MTYHPVVKQITDLLTKNLVWFETFIHDPVITSEEAAKTRPGYTIKQGAKALIVKCEKRNNEIMFCMLVLPANLKLNSKKAKINLDVKNLRFATEDEIHTITGGVQRGAIPPFGTLFGLETLIDPLLFQNEKIVFNAGDRRFSLAMKSLDYKIIMNAKCVDLSSNTEV